MGANIEGTTESGATALHIATGCGETKIVTYLLDLGADFTVTPSTGRTPLHTAAMLGSEEMIEVLLRHSDANIEARDNLGHTALTLAAYFTKPDAVRLLVNRGASVDARDNNGNSSLHWAALKDSPELVRFLVDHNAGVEARNSKQQTPLFVAIMKGNITIARLLEDLHADLRSVNPWGGMLHAAVNSANRSMVQFCLRRRYDKEARNAWGQTPLSQAAEYGYHEIVALLLDHGADSEAEGRFKSKEQWRPLHYAAHGGHEAVVEILLQRGADPTAEDMYGRRAQYFAERKGLDSLAAVLRDSMPISKKTLQLSTSHEVNVFVDWSRKGHVDLVKKMLKQGVNVNSMDVDGQRAITVAAQSGHDLVVGFLINQGADPNSNDANGHSALWWASRHGHKRIVRRLLAQDVSADSADEDGQTTLSAASQGGFEEIVDMLLKRGCNVNAATLYGKTPLMFASTQGHCGVVEQLIDAGADIEFQSPKGDTAISLARSKGHNKVDGQTALCHAARGGETATARLLLELGADVNGQDKNGGTALSWAAKQGHDGTVDALLEFGARKEIKDENGRTALGHAVQARHQTVVVTLLDEGANINSADLRGWTPLTVAVLADDGQLASLLLERGAYMSSEMDTNYSQLCLASRRGNTRLVELLLEHGADVNHLSDNRETPLIMAAQLGHAEVVRSLIEMGAKPALKDDYGRTALSHAKENGHESVIALLCRARHIRVENERALEKKQLDKFNQRRQFRYTPLSQGFIRVLELHPGKSNDIISFDFAIAQLSKDPSFEALSYEWLEKKGSVPVQCADDRILVTPNCAAALRSLRSESESRALWVDAICIDQENKDEVNDQVAMMTDIYRKAKNVIMWLGSIEGRVQSFREVFASLPLLSKAHKKLRPDLNDSAGMFALRIDENNEAKQLVTEALKSKTVVDVLDAIYSASYFSRAWILQEIILGGSRGIVVWGTLSCTWEAFKKALLVFALHKTATYNRTFMDIVLLDFEFSTYGKVELTRIIAALARFQATDARDKVFAALRLGSISAAITAAPRQRKPPVANYKLSVQDVYVEAACYYVDVEHKMPWSLGNRPSKKVIAGLPSWVPDFSMSAEASGLKRALSSSDTNFGDLIDGQPTASLSSIRVHGCILDEVVYKFSITKDTDVFDVLLGVVKTLAELGHGLYDACAGPFLEEGSVEDISGSCCEALLRTLLDKYGEDPECDMKIFTFLAYKLSACEETPLASRNAPEGLRSKVEVWQEEAEKHEGFDLSIYEMIEDNLSPFASEIES
ncbi:hypothetical protein INS49_004432 [Diaporthe citri]|uniref:uncharacterized protein n=1 Tax=Diaporthe citri TaxID=83186 RepID=UPI001C7EA192|nr:uncharacterized protein INS49_004432 [Diaporthe citri]KAG6354415.1 hypothetical protein INS49_004432 [Diaporthe citri]